MSIRKSPIAGSWYEGDEKSLNNQIEKLFENNEFGNGSNPKVVKGEPGEGKLIGIISPHAGYIYSGYTASKSYAELYKYYKTIDTAIIIGPNHRGFYPPVSLYPKGKWNFPNGEVEIDEDIISFARNYDFKQIQGEIDFEVDAHKYEHSIDIQIPFLLYLYGNNFKINTICLANQNEIVTEELASFLYDILDGYSNKKIIVIASSDFSHEDNNYAKLQKNDKILIDAISSGNASKAEVLRKENYITSCGYGGMFTLMKLVNKYKKYKITNHGYSNSNLITGNKKGYCVGYSSFSFLKL